MFGVQHIQELDVFATDWEWFNNFGENAFSTEVDGVFQCMNCAFYETEIAFASGGAARRRRVGGCE